MMRVFSTTQSISFAWIICNNISEVAEDRVSTNTQVALAWIIVDEADDAERDTVAKGLTDRGQAGPARAVDDAPIALTLTSVDELA